MLLTILLNHVPIFCDKLNAFQEAHGAIIELFEDQCLYEEFVTAGLVDLVGMSMVSPPTYYSGKLAVCAQIYLDYYKPYTKLASECKLKAYKLFLNAQSDARAAKAKYDIEFYTFQQEGGCNWTGTDICMNLSNPPTVEINYDFDRVEEQIDYLQRAASWYNSAREKIKHEEARMQAEYKQLARAAADACKQAAAACDGLNKDQAFLIAEYQCLDLPPINAPMGIAINKLRERYQVCSQTRQELNRLHQRLIQRLETIRQRSKCPTIKGLSLGQAILYYSNCSVPNPKLFEEIAYYLGEIRRLSSKDYQRIVKEIGWKNFKTTMDPEAALAYVKSEYERIVKEIQAHPEDYLTKNTTVLKGPCENGQMPIIIYTTYHNPLPISLSFHGKTLSPYATFLEERNSSAGCKVDITIHRSSLFGVEIGEARINIKNAEWAVVNLPDMDSGPCRPYGNKYLCTNGVVHWRRPSAFRLRVKETAEEMHITHLLVEACSYVFYDEVRFQLYTGATPTAVFSLDRYEISPVGITGTFKDFAGCRQFVVNVLTDEALSNLTQGLDNATAQAVQDLVSRGKKDEAIKLIINKRRENKKAALKQQKEQEKIAQLRAQIPKCNGTLCEIFSSVHGNTSQELKQSLGAAWKIYAKELRKLESEYKKQQARAQSLQKTAHLLGMNWTAEEQPLDELFIRAQTDVITGQYLYDYLNNYSARLDSAEEQVGRQKQQLEQEIDGLKQHIERLLPLYTLNYQDAYKTIYKAYFRYDPSFIKSLLQRKTPSAYLYENLRKVNASMESALHKLREMAEEHVKKTGTGAEFLKAGRYVQVLQSKKDDTDPLPFLVALGLLAALLWYLLKQKKTVHPKIRRMLERL